MNTQTKLRFDPWELEMLHMLSEGKRQGDIAARFQSSRGAVSHWLRKTREYAGATTNEQLMVIAMRQGVLR